MVSQNYNIIPYSPEENTVIAQSAAQTVLENKVVLAPFDTVYGLVSNPFDDNAIKKVFNLKDRPTEKTIGVVASDIDQIYRIANDKHLDWIKKLTPGPYTFILEAKGMILSPHCYKNNTIAVRIPDSVLILEIAKLSGGIIAQTSANKSGKNSNAVLEKVLSQFQETELKDLMIILDDSMPTGSPSTIFDLTGDTPRKIER
ncbi:MAG TPA: L-threonylcarbamoyladenylate synthase [bacterium]|nr:L-threonylcarbamoyladenylate synthase [bacterium]